jgi:hypothetical protein
MCGAYHSLIFSADGSYLERERLFYKAGFRDQRFQVSGFGCQDDKQRLKPVTLSGRR